jgi:hypothetical protein
MPLDGRNQGAGHGVSLYVSRLRQIRLRRVVAVMVTVLMVLPVRASASPSIGGPRGLPWPLIIPTANERLGLLPSGRVVPAPALRPYAIGPLPRGAYGVDRKRRLWVQMKDHHLLLMRGHRAIWRSTRIYRATSAAIGIPAFQASRSGIA